MAKSKSQSKKSKPAAAKKGNLAKAVKPKTAVKTTKSKGAESDIIKLILQEHIPLKKLIKVLKDSDKPLKTRQAAFEEFASTLVAHAKPEEEVLYVYMKDQSELREEAFEGEVEHGLADQMVEEAQRTDDEDLWSARVKVLAELVEHHIEEEEEELLPDFRKHSDQELRAKLAQDYMDAKAEFLAEGGDDSPSEDTLDDEDAHASM